jgi:hypothetical protein
MTGRHRWNPQQRPLALEKRVKELEDMKTLDEQRIAELEAAGGTSPRHQ